MCYDPFLEAFGEKSHCLIKFFFADPPLLSRINSLLNELNKVVVGLILIISEATNVVSSVGCFTVALEAIRCISSFALEANILITHPTYTITNSKINLWQFSQLIFVFLLKSIYQALYSFRCKPVRWLEHFGKSIINIQIIDEYALNDWIYPLYKYEIRIWPKDGVIYNSFSIWFQNFGRKTIRKDQRIV